MQSFYNRNISNLTGGKTIRFVSWLSISVVSAVNDYLILIRGIYPRRSQCWPYHRNLETKWFNSPNRFIGLLRHRSLLFVPLQLLTSKRFVYFFQSWAYIDSHFKPSTLDMDSTVLCIASSPPNIKSSSCEERVWAGTRASYRFLRTTPAPSTMGVRSWSTNLVSPAT